MPLYWNCNWHKMHIEKKKKKRKEKEACPWCNGMFITNAHLHLTDKESKFHLFSLIYRRQLQSSDQQQTKRTRTPDNCSNFLMGLFHAKWQISPYALRFNQMCLRILTEGMWIANLLKDSNIFFLTWSFYIPDNSRIKTHMWIYYNIYIIIC